MTTNNLTLIRQQLNIDIIGGFQNFIGGSQNGINKVNNIQNSINNSFDKGDYAISCVKASTFAAVTSTITVGLLLGAILYAEGGYISPSLSNRCLEICFPNYGSMVCRCLFGS